MKLKNPKSTKTSKPTITKKKTSKKITPCQEKAPIRVIEEVRDQFTGLTRPITNRYLENLAVDLIEWSKNDKSIILKEFFAVRGVLKEVFYRWCKTYPPLKDAHEIAKSFIAIRREKGGLTKQYDTTMIMRSMPMYDDEWKEFEEWRASLKNKEEEKSRRQVVIIEKFVEEDSGE
jgi:hypothetical protein